MSLDYILHYGRSKEDGAPGPGSGRYPKGSGDNPYQHAKDVYTRIALMEKEGMSQPDIAKAMGYKSTTELRARKQIVKNEVQKHDIAKAFELLEKGYSNTAVGKELGYTEGTIRNWKKTGALKQTKLDTLTETLKKNVDEKKYLDIGEGVERELGTSKESLRTAVEMLKEQGYTTHTIKVPQATNPSQRTTVMVLVKDDVSYKELRDNKDKIMSVSSKELRDDISNLNMKPPINIDSSRIFIRYADAKESGALKDGVIEIRQGAKDLELPNGNTYAQCRIAVDGTHYLKGMAMYSDTVPKGYDIVFNTNKTSDVPKMKVLKEQTLDKDNVFGATVRQYGKDANGEWKVIGGEGSSKLKQSPINIVNEDKDWEKWSKNLSSQFLSKQYPIVAKEQLKMAYERRKNEFEAIKALTNPTVKRKLLADFADSCDSDAVDLKAASFPRQATHVILPLTKIKDNEIYAPHYKNGEKVILVRYPHEGTFQIPELTVNNNNPQGKKLLGQAKRAVGISAKAAEQLSGADFDGDTVTVIPLKGQKLKYSKPLKELEGYDPKDAYRRAPGDKNVTGETDNFHKQTEMGKVSNLITDMTIKGAPTEDIARAVRHSMCVIDAKKHNLDWKRSEQENGIRQLKEEYQGGPNKGASTIISKASSRYDIPLVREDGVTVTNPKTGKKTRMYIDPDTGKKLYSYHEEKYPVIDKKTGKEVIKTKTTRSTKMYETDDARTLMSPDKYPIERIYADHANRLKAMANEARKAQLSTGDIKYSREAAKKYANEVASLDAKLKQIDLKKPQERRAQLIANTKINAMIRDNPDLKDDRDQLKKKRAQAIGGARARLGLNRLDIKPTDKEWEAIQAGAVSKTKLEKILTRADGERIRELATPKKTTAITAAKQSQMKSLAARGYTQAEIAEQLGISATTVDKYI